MEHSCSLHIHNLHIFPILIKIWLLSIERTNKLLLFLAYQLSFGVLAVEDSTVSTTFFPSMIRSLLIIDTCASPHSCVYSAFFVYSSETSEMQMLVE